MQRLALFISTALCSLLLVGCHSLPSTNTPRNTTPTVPDGPVQSFEQEQLQRALAFEKQNRLPEATEAWSVLYLLRPDEYKDRYEAAQKRTELAAQEYLSRARKEAAKGNTLGAEQLYLVSLAMQPDQPEVADALRGIERARNQKDFLRKPGHTLPPRADVPVGRSSATAQAGSSDGILELEQANNLAADGDVPEAINVLERRITKAPKDDAARKLAAELYVKTARKQQSNDPAAAKAAVERALTLSPRHAGALALAKQMGIGSAKANDAAK